MKKEAELCLQRPDLVKSQRRREGKKRMRGSCADSVFRSVSKEGARWGGNAAELNNGAEEEGWRREKLWKEESRRRVRSAGP